MTEALANRVLPGPGGGGRSASGPGSPALARRGPHADDRPANQAFPELAGVDHR